VVKDGEVCNIKNITSLAIRISRELKGVADCVVERLAEGGRYRNTLILSPPGRGKTTLLRDLIRQFSDGTAASAPCGLQ
jgi:stage III sporulation protein AA